VGTGQHDPVGRADAGFPLRFTASGGSPGRTVVTVEANLFSLVDATDRTRIFAWGMEILEDERTDAIVYRRDPDTGKTFIGHHTSAESALDRYGRRIPLALVWEYEDALEAC
jgi:hypothetical protein